MLLRPTLKKAENELFPARKQFGHVVLKGTIYVLGGKNANGQILNDANCVR